MEVLLFSDISYLESMLSNSRLDFIKHLVKTNVLRNLDLPQDDKTVIHLIDQNINNPLYNQPLQKIINTVSSKGKVDIVVFYICVKFTNNYTMATQCDEVDVPKVLHMEDLHHLSEILNFVSYHSIDNILFNTGIKQVNKIIALNNSKIPNNKIKYHRYDFSIDINVFKDYGLEKKYDILLYGCAHEKIYPFRKRLFDLILKKSSTGYYKVKYIPFKVWKKTKHSVCKDKLAKEINAAYLSIATPSKYDYLIKKYIEIPACNTMVAGEYPPEHFGIFKDIIFLSDKYSDERIIEVLDDALGDKNKLSEKTNKIMEATRNTFNYETVGVNLLNLYKKIILDASNS